MNPVVFMKSHTLPLPYKGFSPNERNANTKRYNEYVELIYSNIKNHTLVFDHLDIEDKIRDCFTYTQDGYGKIRKWILRHKKRIRYVEDFSYLAFGVQINERSEEFQFVYPEMKTANEKLLYPNFIKSEFERMNPLQKIGWLNRNCEFIPFRLVREDIVLFPYEPYKFSHIKRSEVIMEFLKPWIDTEHPQLINDRMYYIYYSYTKDYHYLKRETACERNVEL